jgi:hypothetical protein
MSDALHSDKKEITPVNHTHVNELTKELKGLFPFGN